MARRGTICALLAAASGLAGGCAQTVSPERFLYVYRLSAPPGSMEQGWDAQYTGHDEQYQYLRVRYSTLDRGVDQLLLHGPYREEVLRCPFALLPRDFPRGFAQLHVEGGRTEPEAETYAYIRRYLHGPATWPVLAPSGGR